MPREIRTRKEVAAWAMMLDGEELLAYLASWQRWVGLGWFDDGRSYVLNWGLSVLDDAGDFEIVPIVVLRAFTGTDEVERFVDKLTDDLRAVLPADVVRSFDRIVLAIEDWWRGARPDADSYPEPGFLDAA